MKVILRVRPFNAQEARYVPSNSIQAPRSAAQTKVIGNILKCEGCDVYYTAKDMRSVTRPIVHKEFTFDSVCDIGAAQSSVYEASVQPVLAHVLQGYNATVFAYGATGCGKTHTTFGKSSDPGIVIRALVELFDTQASGVPLELYMSYCEIYNEQLRDLIPAASKNTAVEVREKGGKVVLVNSASHHLRSIDEFLQLIKKGNTNRSVSPTLRNEYSSRSHAILNITVKQPKLQSTLCFVDLAGSERASRHVEGARFREGTNINKSLLSLGNCINALASKATYVPYRQSKLTMVLKPSLEGKGLTIMIACLSPSSDDATETLNTLHYAHTARGIRQANSKLSRGVTCPTNNKADKLFASNQILELTLSIVSKFYVHDIHDWNRAQSFIEEKLRDASTALPEGARAQILRNCQSFISERESITSTLKRVKFD